MNQETPIKRIHERQIGYADKSLDPVTTTALLAYGVGGVFAALHNKPQDKK